MGMKDLPSEVDPILDSILTGNEEQRIHAIEFLDNILDIQLKKELIPIAESVMMDSFSQDKLKNLSLKTFSELECYKMLLTRKDASLKQSVLYLIKKTNNKKFIPLVSELINEKNDNVKNQAIETLNHLSQ
jgi:AAA family ATP:ADP antiporter